MALNADEINIIISADSHEAEESIKRVTDKLDELSKETSQSSSKMMSNISNVIKKYLSIATVVAGVVKSVKSSISRIEDENLFEVALGNSADDIRKWSDEVENAVGVSGAWLRKTTGTLVNMTTSMGVASDDAVRMAKNFSLLAQDMASFYNISPEEALNKLESGLAGQSRALQQLGIMVRETDLEQTALTLGIEKVNGEFTSAQRAVLVYNTVLNATKNAQGDLARTLNTPANQLRMLTTNVQNLGVAIGNLFQPILNVALPALNALVMATTRAFNTIASLFGIEISSSGSESLPDSIGATVEGLDNASDSAKALKKQLASFDEMNVLRDNSSSSGGASGGIANYGGFDFADYNTGLDKVTNKASELAKKIFDEISSAFDLSKITKNFKKLWNDIKKGLSVIGGIIGDIWNDYGKPFINWFSGDFSGAVFNVLGSSIELLGNVIATVWDAYLKPFVDAFLKPIAEFTGGVIVNVLNGIADALRAIAQNEIAVSVLSGIIASIGVILGYNLVAGFLTGLINSLGILNTTFMALPIAMESSTVAMTAFTSAGALATNIVTGIKTAFTNFINFAVSPLGIALEAVVAVALALKMAIEAVKLEQMNAELEAKNYTTTEEYEKQMTEWNNDAIQRQIDLKRELEGVQANLAEANLNLLRSQDGVNEATGLATELARKHNMTLEEAIAWANRTDIMNVQLTASDRELYEAVQNLTVANERYTEAQEKVRDLQVDNTNVAYEYDSAVWKEIATTRQAEIEQLAIAGKYEEVAQKLQDLSNETIEYQNANGEMARFSKEDVKSMAEFIGDRLADVDDDWGTTWAEMWKKANYNVDNIKKSIDTIDDGAYSVGANTMSGLNNGLNNNSGSVLGTIGNIAKGITNKFKSILGIGSPSKVFAENGMWIDAGLANGITDNSYLATNAVAKLADETASIFDGFSINTEVGTNLSSDIASMSSELQLDAEKTPVHVVVNMGDDKLIDKVVSGVNELGNLYNYNVINI